MPILKWSKKQFVIYCPYCSKQTIRVRFNFDTGNEFFIKCESCNKEFGFRSVGIANDGNYADLNIIVAKKDLENIKVFCPFDRSDKVNKISEAVSVDEHEDVDIESYLKCDVCQRRFYLMGIDTEKDYERQYWNDYKSNFHS